ncbi:hypothetical protein PCC7418_2286 [Halothece sp. PCC 7418]|uniref:hypothetical protein n=1 Tax=Halothece sp. (strain PCC 7418) TaxID=65093 RepID=UPI0002A088AC|nr:hypothetical protein [Halothece sp. PCC 7418]AFZ44438.1 hypothetical protein PCC7418_2286 [Halothece sp. PCC 7418]
MNITSLLQWFQSVQIVMAALVMLVMASVPINPLSAEEQRETKEKNQMRDLPNGTYLYGQSPQPNQIGQEYIVFEVKDGQLVGALYMPHSEFSCFQGEMKGNELAMTVDHPYENTRYPYAIALEAVSPLAGRNGQTSLPVTLKGYHPLEEISPNDQRMLATCQNEFR